MHQRANTFANQLRIDVDDEIIARQASAFVEVALASARRAVAPRWAQQAIWHADRAVELNTRNTAQRVTDGAQLDLGIFFRRLRMEKLVIQSTEVKNEFALNYCKLNCH